MNSSKIELLNYHQKDINSTPFLISNAPCYCDCHSCNYEMEQISKNPQTILNTSIKTKCDRNSEKFSTQLDTFEKNEKVKLSYEYNSFRNQKQNSCLNLHQYTKSHPIPESSLHINPSSTDLFEEYRTKRIKYSLLNKGNEGYNQKRKNLKETVSVTSLHFTTPQKDVLSNKLMSNSNDINRQSRFNSTLSDNNYKILKSPNRRIVIPNNNYLWNKNKVSKCYDYQSLNYFPRRYSSIESIKLNDEKNLKAVNSNSNSVLSFYSRQNFGFEILPERNKENKENDFSKDLLISELNSKIIELNKEINFLHRQKYEQSEIINQMEQREEKEKRKSNEEYLDLQTQNENYQKIEKMKNELETMKEMNQKLMNKISQLELENEKQKLSLKEKTEPYNNYLSEGYIQKENNITSNSKLPYKPPEKFYNISIESLNISFSYIGNAMKINKRIETSTSISTQSKIISLSNVCEKSKLVSKFNLNNDLSNIETKITTKTYPLSEKLVYKLSTDQKNVICFDFSTKQFHLFNYADYGNYDTNSSKDPSGDIFTTHNKIFYIITGDNNDKLYSYNFSKKAMNKLCQLMNNHHKGALISYKNNLICLSGTHNKKAEIYSISKNQWDIIPELNIERSEFSAIVISNQYLFALFGYNVPKKEYLNSIEYLNLEQTKSNWNFLNYKNENLVSMYIKGATCVNYQDQKIIIIGGYNGEFNQIIENFIQLIIGESFPNDNVKVEMVDRKLKDFYKNKGYMFSSGITSFTDDEQRSFEVVFDSENRIHVFQIDNMAHDIFYLN